LVIGGQENKVREVVFYASIKASFALAAYLVYALFFILVALLIGQTYFYLGVLCIPLLGLFSLYYWEFKKQGAQQAKIAKLDQAAIRQILQKRQEILSKFNL